jgi:hypothetical protein
MTSLDDSPFLRQRKFRLDLYPKLFLFGAATAIAHNCNLPARLPVPKICQFAALRGS